jgi:excisionase family DNA binding protein
MERTPNETEIYRDSRGRVAYRLREVSEMIGIPVSTLRAMVRRGELNPITSFRTWLIPAEDLQLLLKQRLRNGMARIEQSSTEDTRPCSPGADGPPVNNSL